MTTIVLTIHVIVSLALIIIVLLQAGKGAEMGAAFGGASKTVFGPRGAAGPMTKITVGAAVMFMLTSIYLTRASRPGAESSLINLTEPTATEEPAAAEQPVSLPEIPVLPPGGEAPMSPASPSELPPLAPVSEPGSTPLPDAGTPTTPAVPEPAAPPASESAPGAEP